MLHLIDFLRKKFLFYTRSFFILFQLSLEHTIWIWTDDKLRHKKECSGHNIECIKSIEYQKAKNYVKPNNSKPNLNWKEKRRKIEAVWITLPVKKKHDCEVTMNRLQYLIQFPVLSAISLCVLENWQLKLIVHPFMPFIANW